MRRRSAHAVLQLVVLLWGFTAILGEAISLPAIPLVWYRLLIVVAVLGAFVPLRGTPLQIPARAALRYLAIGATIGVHWLCFFAAIKAAGVATAVLSLSTVAFFTSLIEPIVFRRRVAMVELAIGAIVVVGASLLIQLELRADPLGLALGLGAAVFAATFGVLNGKLARTGEPPARLMLYEMLGALLAVSVFVAAVPSHFVSPMDLGSADLGWLAILAIACTVLPQIWLLYVLRVLSPFTAAVSVNLEPVYALVLAALVFPDTAPPSTRFYLGAAVLFALVIVNGVRRAPRG